MKLKNYNGTVFTFAFLLIGLLLIPSFIGAFALDEGTIKPNTTFMYFFAHLFTLLRFPSHTLLWPLITWGGPFTYFGGLVLNCMFYGLIVERIVSLFRRN